MGQDVVGVSRSGGGAFGLAADRRDVSGLSAIVRERRVDAVIDLLALTEADTLDLLARLGGEVGRWVMASSCDVYRNYEGLHRRGGSKPILSPLDEGSPLRITRYPYRSEPLRSAGAPDAWFDHYDKIPLETALRTGLGARGVILRLPMVFGPSDRQRRFRWIVEPMVRGCEHIVVDPGWAAWRTTYGYVEDVGHALAVAAVHPNAPGHTFNIGEGEAVSHRGWIDRFAAQLGWRGEVLQAPAPPESPIAALDLDYPLIIDSKAFRAACAWREPTPVDEALARTISDERSRG
jgi:nucleoside-diphosphate-sugar epimerase